MRGREREKKTRANPEKEFAAGMEVSTLARGNYINRYE